MASWNITATDDWADIRFYKNKTVSDLLKNYHFESNGYRFKVVAKTDTDGASVPKPLMMFFGDKFSKENLFAAIAHDAAYTCDIMIMDEHGNWVPVYIQSFQADALFRNLRDFSGGWKIANWPMWLGIRTNTTIMEQVRKWRGKAKSYPSFSEFKAMHPKGVLLPFPV